MSTLPVVHLVSSGRPIFDGQVNPVWSAMVQTAHVTDPAIPVALKHIPSTVKVAIELGCSLAATALKIPVPRGMLVLANPDDVPGLAEHGRPIPGLPEVLCYGSVLRWPERARARTGDPLVDDYVWKRFCDSATAAPSAAWDELVANGDRHAGNFILEGSKYWLIDHDHALKPLAKSVKAVLSSKTRADLVSYRAQRNQVAAQLVRRRPGDHAILDQPKALSTRAKTLEGLVTMMGHWRSGNSMIDDVLSDAETVVRGIILRLPALALLLDARLAGPQSSLQWTSPTRPLFEP
ncbi:hypothetical protein [Variovorax sp. OV700]|uniref:hypothetical protein n=1 Tax=Variovorax sp. OV700 TaxID=1882826 RepID=UPI0011139FC2|nr:hypothetical protein [Variovorax sp. OV700]